jgi:hypothetical protein
MKIKELNEQLNRIQDYEEALVKIEMYGHTSGHGHGYTCANIAEEALRKHLWKPEVATDTDESWIYRVNPTQGFLSSDDT